MDDHTRKHNHAHCGHGHNHDHTPAPAGDHEEEFVCTTSYGPVFTADGVSKAFTKATQEDRQKTTLTLIKLSIATACLGAVFGAVGLTMGLRMNAVAEKTATLPIEKRADYKATLDSCIVQTASPQRQSASDPIIAGCMATAFERSRVDAESTIAVTTTAGAFGVVMCLAGMIGMFNAVQRKRKIDAPDGP